MLKLPVKLFFGENCIAMNKETIKAFGKKALIVTGHSSSKNGSLLDVKSALDSLSIPYFVYDNIEENPSTGTIIKARDYAVENEVEFVIGIGGGSPMDAAKAIAVMVSNKSFGEDFLYNSNMNTSAIPILEVPTTCGSGAEVTPNAVLTIHDKRTKMSSVHRVFPSAAFIDPNYILDAPYDLIASTALDALTHMIESFVNSKANHFTKLICINGMMLWCKCKDVIDGKNKINSEISGYLMLASSLAGMAIAHTGTSLPHRLSYNLTYDFHVSHGKAVAYFISRFLKFCDKNDIKVILGLTGFSSIEKFDEFIEKIIGSIPVSIDTFNRSIDEILNNQKVLNSVKFDVDRKKLLKICRM